MKQASSKQRGFTLLELLTTLTVTAILISIAIPSFAYLANKVEGDSITRQLIAQVQLARSAAIDLNRIITLCNSSDGTSCNKVAMEQLLIFDDANHNRRWDASEYRYSVATSRINGSLKLSVSRGVNYMRFSPEGYALEFGNLTYCPQNKKPQLMQSIIIDRVGRVRPASDNNHDGIREDSNGKNLNCS